MALPHRIETGNVDGRRSGYVVQTGLRRAGVPLFMTTGSSGQQYPLGSARCGPPFGNTSSGADFGERIALPHLATILMDVRIVDFPETRVAAVEHHGNPALEHETARRLIAWRVANRVPPERHATYGIHYTSPSTTPLEEHRVDLCVAFEPEVAFNEQGVVNKTIPGARCALVRHHGSRENVTAAAYLYSVWLPSSGEIAGDFPIFFHYVNVGPEDREEDMITDVYLPLAPRT